METQHYHIAGFFEGDNFHKFHVSCFIREHEVDTEMRPLK